jgi:hypothetical protein
MKFGKELVISRYKEDLSWVNFIPSCMDLITIYNKGEKLEPFKDKRVRIFEIPNVGREAQTWTHHFVTRRESLFDNTFLVQGNPFEHSSNFFGRLKHVYKETTSLTDRYKINWPPKELTDSDLVKYAYGKKIRLGNIEHFGGETYKNDKPQKEWFKDVWEFVFTSPCPETYHYGYAAMWCVVRKDVLFRSERLWETLNLLLRNYKNGQPITSIIDPWSMEALWRALFSDEYETIY